MALDFRIKAVGFDMDGTFMHTRVDYVKMDNIVTDELLSLGVPETDIDRRDGSKMAMERGIAWLIAHGRADAAAGIRERVGVRATAVELEHADEAEPFPGSIDTLRLLKKRGYPVGVLTRGSRQYAETVLGNAGVLKEFDAVVARDDYPEEDSKPSPMALRHLGKRLGVPAENILYLGDHKVDWMTADAAGAEFIGVTSGSYSQQDWETKIGPQVRTIGCVGDLRDLL